MRSLVVVLALLALPLSAQERLVETFEVRVVNVDVVVTDRAGKPVPGLTAKDFEILEEKRTQAITNFSEFREGSAATPAAPEQVATPAVKPRHFILFVETRAMHPVLRKHVLQSMKQFVDEQMKPGDEATVVSWNEALSIDAPLTADKTALHAALDGIAKTAAVRATKGEFARVQQRCNANLQMAKSGRMAIRMAYEDCVGEARTEAQRLTLFSRMLLNSLDVAMTTVAGIDGRKVLVMAGTELPLRPGMDMFGWANNLFSPYMRGFDAAIQRPADQEREQRDML
ncbi:MAG TPA: VWA domain-containing protein, partial [Thermoanaerobaculia bacterium]|nr:VWA domain-containing protein [Thermoanaerobaculia bacterium]